MLQQLIVRIILLIWLLHIRGIVSLKCYKCHGSECEMEENLNDTTECDPLDSCITVFAGSIILYRGCYSSLPSRFTNKCRMYDTDCSFCTKDLCNNEGPLTCMECSSGNQVYLCYYILGTVRCPILTSFRRRCFNPTTTLGMNWKETTRGCLTDLNVQCSSDRCPACLANPRADCNDIFALFNNYNYSNSSSASAPNGRNYLEMVLTTFICIYLTL